MHTFQSERNAWHHELLIVYRNCIISLSLYKWEAASGISSINIHFLRDVVESFSKSRFIATFSQSSSPMNLNLHAKLAVRALIIQHKALCSIATNDHVKASRLSPLPSRKEAASEFLRVPRSQGNFNDLFLHRY